MTNPTIGTVAMGDTEAAIRKNAEYAASEFFARVGEGEAEGDVVIDLIVKAALAALSTRPAQEPVAVAIVPPYCSGSALSFDPGVLHVSKDGSGYIAINEEDFVLEDDRCEGERGPEGSVHWITRMDASEMIALRDFLNGNAVPAPQPVLSQPEVKAETIIDCFERTYPELYWHIAKGKICAGEPLYGAIIYTDGGTEMGDGESAESAEDAFRIAVEDAGLTLSALCPLSGIPAQAGEVTDEELSYQCDACSTPGYGPDAPCHCSPSTPPVNAMGNKTGGERT